MDQDNPRKRLRSKTAAAYLRNRHGLPISDKTFVNRRALGTGPDCRYFGNTPLYDPDVLDSWAAAELREHSGRQRAA